MQKGNVSHLSVSFFVINPDMLNLYVWSQKLNILIVLVLSKQTILAKPVLFKYNEDWCVLGLV